jgi:hypothetical protein
MLIRKEGIGEESRRDSLARRLEAVAGIRRREEARTQELVRRYVEPRFAAIDQHNHGQDAA